MPLTPDRGLDGLGARVHLGVVLRLAWFVPLFTLLAPATVAAQSEHALERIEARGLHVSNAMLGNWHDQLHVERDELRNTLPSPDFAGPAATLILSGAAALSGVFLTLTSAIEGPGEVLLGGLVTLSLAGGLLVVGIAWLIERAVVRRSSDAVQRHRSVARALNHVHRVMRRRGIQRDWRRPR